MKTTFLGQLSLIMLCERMHLIGVQLISANTDGIVIQYHKDQKDAVNKVHKEWEEITGYILEDTDYERIFFSNVNNYLAEIIDSNGDIVKHKYKGTYEIDKDWHKDHSNRIVSIAVARACLFEIPPEDTIRNHMNIDHYDDIGVDAHGIYDFCSSVRARGDAKYETQQLIGNELINTSLPKTNRYFVSNNGVYLKKILPPLEGKDPIENYRKNNPQQLDLFHFTDDVVIEKPRESFIEANYQVTIFNRAFNGPFDINEKYYINECNKILDKL